MKSHKSAHLAELFEQRILKGDYTLNGIPAERQLASQLGVSHMTARQETADRVKGWLLGIRNDLRTRR